MTREETAKAQALLSVCMVALVLGGFFIVASFQAPWWLVALLLVALVLNEYALVRAVGQVQNIRELREWSERLLARAARISGDALEGVSDGALKRRLIDLAERARKFADG